MVDLIQACYEFTCFTIGTSNPHISGRRSEYIINVKMASGEYGEYLIDLDDKEDARHKSSIEEFGVDYGDYDNDDEETINLKEPSIIERAILAPLLRSGGGNDYSSSGRKAREVTRVIFWDIQGVPKYCTHFVLSLWSAR